MTLCFVKPSFKVPPWSCGIGGSDYSRAVAVVSRLLFIVFLSAGFLRYLWRRVTWTIFFPTLAGSKFRRSHERTNLTNHRRRPKYVAQSPPLLAYRPRKHNRGTKKLLRIAINSRRLRVSRLFQQKVWSQLYSTSPPNIAAPFFVPHTERNRLWIGPRYLSE